MPNVYFLDSLDHYGSLALMAQKGWSVGGSSGGAINTYGAYGRNGTNGILIHSDGIITRALPANLQTVCFGAAIRFLTRPANSGIMYLSEPGGVHVYVAMLADGSIRAYNSALGVLGTSAPSVIANTTAHFYVEVKVFIHDTTGSIEIRVNGNTTPVLNLTAIDTKGTANAYATVVGGPHSLSGSNVDMYVDDIYIADDFLGDVRIEALSPSGAGATTNFTPSTGANYQCVDEAATPNDDTDYVSSSVVNDKDTYAMGNLASVLGAVVAVAVTTYDRKDDAGARTHSHVTRLSGTEDTGAAFSPTTAYAFHQTVFTTKPGGGAWSIADVNAMEAGLKIAS